jgi:hypothetical protein
MAFPEASSSDLMHTFQSKPPWADCTTSCHVILGRRKSFERLIRKLLQMPSRPAVVLLNTYAWFNTDPYEASAHPAPCSRARCLCLPSTV